MNKEKLVAQLIIDEGRRYRIYTDTVGKITGGVGRNLTDVGFSDNEITLMLENDIKSAESALDKNFDWWRAMTDARQNVLLNMCFNLGIKKLLDFTNTLRYMKSGEYENAATNMLASKWAKQVGLRANRLAETMRLGVFK